MTSLQLAEEISITQKTAWFVSHRLRKAFEHPYFIKDLPKDNVEMDKTYLGGKNKNRHKDKKGSRFPRKKMKKLIKNFANSFLLI